MRPRLRPRSTPSRRRERRGTPDDALVLASGAAATLTASGPDRFAEIRAGADDLFDSGDVHAGTEAARPRLFGGFAFHDGGCDGDPWGRSRRRGSSFRACRSRSRTTAWLTAHGERGRRRRRPGRGRGSTGHRARPACDGLATTVDRPPRPRDRGDAGRRAARRGAGASRPRSTGSAAATCRRSAGAGAGGRPRAFPRAATLDRLAEKYPDCHRYYFEPDAGGERLLRRDPERLVALRGRTVETDALAGTTGRGETPAEDEWLARELLDDAKNVHEHELVADTVREQLEPFAASISAGERRVRRLATVQHLHTPITAELNADRHVLDLVEALHTDPPAVGGLPPDRARNDPRHGAVRPRVVRRAGRLDRRRRQRRVRGRDPVRGGDPRRATLFAGVGLVADSDPDREWDEVQLKVQTDTRRA